MEVGRYNVDGMLGADPKELDSALFVCLFVKIHPENPYSTFCGWEGSKPPGSGHTRTEAHTATCLPKTAVRGTCQSMVSTEDWWVRYGAVLYKLRLCLL